MGTDVDFYVEYKIMPEGPWIGLGHFSIDRHRALCETLANFGDLKGFPSDCSIGLFGKIYVQVVQEFEIPNLIGHRFCTEKLAEKWIKVYGSSIYHCGETGYDYILFPWYEAASWLSYSDFRNCIETDVVQDSVGVDTLAVLAAVKSIEEGSDFDATRIVFWFS